MAVSWIGLVVWALATGAWGDPGTPEITIIVVLGILDAIALGAAALWLRRPHRSSHLWAVLVLTANAALTLTDQMGWIDTLFLALTLAALAVVLVRTRWYWQRTARQGQR